MATVIEHKFQVTGDGNLTAKMDQSAKAATRAAKATGELRESWQGTVTAISTAGIAITGAIKGMVSVVQGFVAGALEGEAATIKLSKSLKIFGGFSKEAVAAFGAYADQLELVTGIQAEATLESISLGKSLGLSNDDARQLTETAAGMSKALGVDLNTAMRQIIATFDGTSGRLGKLIPELDGFSEAQLRSGAAVDLLQKKFGGFLEQTDGAGDALKRIGNAFNQMKDGAADSFLAGFDASGLSADLMESFAGIKTILTDNSQAFEALGRAAADAVRFIADPNLWAPIINTIGVVVATIQNSGMVDAIKGWAKAMAALFDNLFNHVLLGAVKLSKGITTTLNQVSLGAYFGNATKTLDAFQTDVEGMIDKNVKTIADGGQSITATFRTIGGAWESAWASVDSRPIEPKVKAPGGASTGTKTGGFSAPVRGDGGKEAGERAKEAAKTILEVVGMIDEATIRSANGLVAEQSKALEALAAKKSALGMLGVENETLFADAESKVRAFFANKAADSYAQAEMSATQKSAAEIEKRKADLMELVGANLLTQERANEIVQQGEAVRRQEAEKGIAALGKQNSDRLTALRAAYEEDLAAYKDTLEAKGLADSDYFERYKAERQKVLEAESQKVTTQATEQKIGKVQSLASAATGGINSIIGAVGNMFGPIGSLIGTIVQFLNMSPDMFKKMIDSLIQAAMNVVPNLMANIPVLIEQVVKSIPASIAQSIQFALGGIGALLMDIISGLIEALADIIPQFLDVSFWMDIADDAFKAFMGAFKNLWSVIFKGKSLKKEIAKTNDAKGPDNVVRYAADANAGDNKFKVRELQASSGQAKTFEERVETATEESGQGLFDFIKEAWQWVIDNVFKPIAGWVKDAFAPVIEAFKAAFAFAKDVTMAVWDSFKSVVSDAWNTFKSLGVVIWDGLKAQFSNAWETFAGAGKSIWEGFKALFSGDWGGAWAKFKEAGSKMWEGLKNSFEGSWDTIKKIGTVIWDGLWSGLSKIGSGAWDIGKKIFDGFGSLMEKFNPVNLLGKLFGDKSGTGKIEGWLKTDFPFLKFAQGGFVPGSAGVPGDSLANDKVAAMLSPGEFVLPRSVTQDKELMGWIMTAVRGGVQPKAFGDTVVGKLAKGDVKGAGDDAGQLAKDKAKQVADAISALSGDAKAIYDFLKSVGGGLDVGALAKDPFGFLASSFKGVIDKFTSGRIDGAMSGFMQKLAFGGPVLGFNAGGIVPGLGSRDSVPAMLTPGELVITKSQTRALMGASRSGGGSAPVINLTVAFQGGFTPDRDTIEKKVVPPVIEALKRASRNGTQVVSSKGVY